MILVDANLLLYAKVAGLPRHAAAKDWLEARLNGDERVGLPWPSLLAFIRIVTNPRVFDRPLSSRSAWAQAAEWLALGNVWIPLPTDRHAAILGQIIEETGAAADLVPDAHLAALALEHGLVVCSTDSDFARFKRVRWENPLA